MSHIECRSRNMLKKPESSFNRSVFKAMGFSDKDLEKPIVGIANSWSELVPGHYNLRQLAEAVKQGIAAAGGTPVEFGVMGPCDGIAQGHEGMHYILPSRDLLAADIEIMAQAHSLDGIVMLGSCDKIVPAMLMAAARLDIPAVLLPGGPMLGGTEFDGRKSDLTSCSEGVGMLKAGEITEDELDALEEGCAPGCGSCSFYGTANTMCCLAEAMGMTLENGALTPAVFAERTRIAKESGEVAVKLIKNGITARKIITKASIENAIVVLNATGGSTNAVLHLLALGAEIDVKPEEITAMLDRRYESTPQIVKVNPASKYNMEDFYFSGGIPRVLAELENMLHAECLTVSGSTVKEIIERTKKSSRFPVNRSVIRTVEEPFGVGNGVAILKGNLAPEGCVTKPAAISADMHFFEGSAKVFDCEEDAEAAILSGGISAGDVVVIRYEGPKGGPGMREMYKAMKYLYGMGLGKSTAVITDGRFSGTNNGCFVGHISPEAAEGGVIAVVRSGDRITIDIPSKTITLNVDDEEIERRLAEWVRPEPKYRFGWLGIYSRLAESASRGAVLKLL